MNTYRIHLDAAHFTDISCAGVRLKDSILFLHDDHDRVLAAFNLNAILGFEDLTDLLDEAAESAKAAKGLCGGDDHLRSLN